MHDLLPLLTGDARALEALSRVRVLYTDLDGTLIARGGSVLADGDGAPSTIGAEAIVEVNRAGLEVVPVSGRSRLQLREVTQILGWNAYIAEAGAIIVHGTGLNAEMRVDHGTWPPDHLAPGVSAYDAINEARAFEALRTAFPGRIEQYVPWQIEREVTLLLRGCLDLAAAQRVLDGLDLPLDVIDNGMVRSPGTLTCTDGQPHAYHVVPKGVSKARSIEADLAWRGLTSDQAAAIGDSATDLEMADAVGVMVLVANAFASDGVITGLSRTTRDNVWRTAGERTEGWAEFSRAWVAAVRG